MNRKRFAIALLGSLTLTVLCAVSAFGEGSIAATNDSLWGSVKMRQIVWTSGTNGIVTKAKALGGVDGEILRVWSQANAGTNTTVIRLLDRHDEDILGGRGLSFTSTASNWIYAAGGAIDPIAVKGQLDLSITNSGMTAATTTGGVIWVYYR